MNSQTIGVYILSENEKQILAQFDLPFYPTYKEGDTIMLTTRPVGAPGEFFNPLCVIKVIHHIQESGKDHFASIRVTTKQVHPNS